MEKRKEKRTILVITSAPPACPRLRNSSLPRSISHWPETAEKRHSRFVTPRLALQPHGETLHASTVNPPIQLSGCSVPPIINVSAALLTNRARCLSLESPVAIRVPTPKPASPSVDHGPPPLG